nr:protein bni4 [Quercus suber]
MADVLSPPMQSSSIPMMHSRPSSADAFQGQPPRLAQTPRNMYNGQNPGYRGTSAGPVQPYAFQSTPTLRPEARTSSAPSTPHGVIGGHRQGHVPSVSTSSDTSSVPSSSKDDSVVGSQQGSLINLSSQLPDLSFTPFEVPAKASPDRYRRPAQKRTDSSSTAPKTTAPSIPAPGPAMTNVDHIAPGHSRPLVQHQGSVDDMAVKSSSELAKRYRRRSLNTLETQSLGVPPSQRPSSHHSSGATSTPTTIRPVSFHSQASNEEGEGMQRNPSMTSFHSTEIREPARPSSAHEASRSVVVPPRGSSEPMKRHAIPSPLSRQSDAASPTKARTYAAVAQSGMATPSPAAAQLAALSDKDLNKGMKSRLRRAFSFGSAQELRRAAGENNQAAHQAQQAKEMHQQRVDDELDAEQQEIARRQEEAGIGAGIYSGQGGFTGSTDNLSISSTASSASMMLRKMGRGAKKGARSIKGLFRPKSVIGVPAADGPVHVQAGGSVEPSVAQVSMVTVEAERQKVNVNANSDVAANAGGVTGFPKLERNSLDAATATAQSDARGSADGTDALSRRSVVGSDKERAEVLAAVKKGILKRAATGSPSGSPVIRAADLGHTPGAQLLDSPSISMPSTPKDGAPGRTGSMNGDYFTQRVVTLAKSMPTTPGGTARSISFSPRIQFHDAWSATDYDRRGEVATCNRLTPMLAQQIKEELNTFKMVRQGMMTFVPPQSLANREPGNGGPRAKQATHTLLLMTFWDSSPWMIHSPPATTTFTSLLLLTAWADHGIILDFTGRSHGVRRETHHGVAKRNFLWQGDGSLICPFRCLLFFVLVLLTKIHRHNLD